MSSRSIHTAGRLRSVLRGAYLFEWVAFISLAAMIVFLYLGPVKIEYWRLLLFTGWMMLEVAGASVVAIGLVRVGHAMRGSTGTLEALRSSELRQPRFWMDLVRLILSFAVVETSHFTLKLYVPVIHHANFDGVLREVDRHLFLGHNPNVLVLQLFSEPSMLRVFDFLYSQFYFVLLWGGVVIFLTFLPGRARTAFFSSFLLMWQLGLLLYVLLPSWGPVFVHPEIFESALQHCPATVTVQRGLFRETVAMIRGQYDIVVHYFGLAAFPSLHVAVFTLYALWARRVGKWWTVWNVVVGLLVLLGSLITGYHYFVDGLGGFAVAGLAYAVSLRWELPTAAAC